MTKISIAIPAYIKNSSQVIFLKDALDSILEQTFKDYEVVITDHSTINDIGELCEQYCDKMKIIYLKNFYGRGIPTENANFCLNYCFGEYIKILHCDDFLVSSTALEKIVSVLDTSDKKWLVNGFNHTKDGKSFYTEMIPKYPNNILIGNNLLGSPTNVTIRNEYKEYFDSNITLNIDVEWYHRLRIKYGMPLILEDILTTSRVRDDRVSEEFSVNKDIDIEDDDGLCWGNIQSELDYIQKKHKHFFENMNMEYIDD